MTSRKILLLVLLSFSALSQSNEHWYQQPMRILQTVLRQPDAASYDTDSLLNYMNAVHANTLVINGGGIVDYFQNKMPMANVNPYMGKRDLLADIVKACHEQNIKVIARVDFRGVHKERYDLHPDWFAKDEKGEPIILNYTKPGLYAPCYNGHYRNEHSEAFINQLMDKYYIDGIWHNSVNFHDVCYCDVCQSLYQEEYGENVPVKASSEHKWETYYKWNEKMASQQLAKMRAVVKKYGEDKSYAAEVFDMYRVEQQKHTGINLYSAAKYFDFFVTVSFIANNNADVRYKDIYYPAAIVKFLKSLEPEKSPVILFGGNGTEHRYTYDPPIDSRLWLWQAAANGGGFWNCYFNGDFPTNTLDQRNAHLASDAYQYLEKNEVLLDQLEPVTDIALFYSKASGQLVGDEDFGFPIRGMLRLLEENHYQYGFLSDRNLTRKDLDKYKVLLMPNVAAISKADLYLIKDWVNDGGSLLATHKTSLFDDLGVSRSDFGFSELFGASYSGEEINTSIDCYQTIENRTEILKGFEQTKLLHNGGQTLLVNAKGKAKILTGYLPKINNQPPENAFPDSWDSKNPIMLSNTYGKGKVVYFSNQVAKLNYTIGHPDYNDLLVNSINSLLGEHLSLKTNAPASVNIYLNKSKSEEGTYQLALVNTSGATQRPFRSLIPVSNLEIELPFKLNSFKVLHKEGETKINQTGNVLSINNLTEFVSLKLMID
ncbi:alpha-amylase family protein [uncultured Arcticibacterium sp.]|uniref:alpha-amylase family protein n=1 Tax=uncultured Arcticibacterium sp. TaxID=2173042 RepID=UPI0030F6DE4C